MSGAGTEMALVELVREFMESVGFEGEVGVGMHAFPMKSDVEGTWGGKERGDQEVDVYTEH